ncbi:hypothetical protein EVAR_85083_1 [Eumeta japonica]|uniref:Uncharacterized protein n=1 Tax=Eumeta variegata TaxID=151549 RepID=A0A4C1XCZ2_EUMVA|nr:hypothetical protein EVAR_85083_1 [Eumeta japonica]
MWLSRGHARLECRISLSRVWEFWWPTPHFSLTPPPSNHCPLRRISYCYPRRPKCTNTPLRLPMSMGCHETKLALRGWHSPRVTVALGSPYSPLGPYPGLNRLMVAVHGVHSLVRHRAYCECRKRFSSDSAVPLMPSPLMAALPQRHIDRLHYRHR